jgi:5'-3' exonuclease
LKPHYVLVDIAQIVHGAYHWLGLAHYDRSNGDVPPVLEHKVRQKLNTMKSHCGNGVEYILVLDEHSVRKRRIYPEYKANHGPHSMPVKEVVQRISGDGEFGKVCVSPGNEADDAIATLCARNRDGFSTIISSDCDLWQLLAPNTRIISPVTKVFVEQSHVEAKYGKALRSHHVPLAKSLWGDAGDNVPISIPRSPKKLRSYVAQSDGSLENFISLVEQSWDDLDETLRLNWLTGEAQLRLNFELVKLDENCEILWDKDCF